MIGFGVEAPATEEEHEQIEEPRSHTVGLYSRHPSVNNQTHNVIGLKRFRWRSKRTGPAFPMPKVIIRWL